MSGRQRRPQKVHIYFELEDNVPENFFWLLEKGLREKVPRGGFMTQAYLQAFVLDDWSIVATSVAGKCDVGILIFSYIANRINQAINLSACAVSILQFNSSLLILLLRIVVICEIPSPPEVT